MTLDEALVILQANISLNPMNIKHIEALRTVILSNHDSIQAIKELENGFDKKFIESDRPTAIKRSLKKGK